MVIGKETFNFVLAVISEGALQEPYQLNDLDKRVSVNRGNFFIDYQKNCILREYKLDLLQRLVIHNYR